MSSGNTPLAIPISALKLVKYKGTYQQELRTMQVKYLISSQFDYSRVIVPDQGYYFADDYGWPTASVNDLRATPVDVVIVDQRLQREEFDDVRALILNSKMAFFFRLVDPYWEYARAEPLFSFVSEIMDLPRVHLMFTYQPTEITALVASKVRKSGVVHAPYVYRTENELGIDHQNRAHAVLFSGAQNARIYPLRTKMLWRRALWPPLWALSARLSHPGYPDIGHQKSHSIVGDRYVAHLAKFRFAAVCSSRCRLEFLKYRECAYAGVVPVGDMPATLLDCPASAWVPWRRNFIELTRSLRAMSDTTGAAEEFRRFMRERRNVTDMRAWVTEQISRLA